MSLSAKICLLTVKKIANGNNKSMREIGQNLEEAKQKVKRLLDVDVLLKVNQGRGKTALMKGRVIALFPQVFSVKLDTGETKTFPYSDVHTNGILFLNPNVVKEKPIVKST